MRAEFKAEQDKIAKLEVFNCSYIHGKSHFEDDGTQNYLVFQPVCRCFKKIDDNDHISGWKFKGLSYESIKPSATSDNSLAASLNCISVRPRIKFCAQCLKQGKFTYHLKNLIIHIVNEINLWAHKECQFYYRKSFVWSC